MFKKENSKSKTKKRRVGTIIPSGEAKVIPMTSKTHVLQEESLLVRLSREVASELSQVTEELGITEEDVTEWLRESRRQVRAELSKSSE